jgi:N-acetylmuramoyl-L-alanine amidase
MYDELRRRFLRRLVEVSGTSLAVSASPLVWAAGSSTRVQGVRVAAADRTTRVVFDLSGSVEHSIFMLHAPERVVIDIKRAFVNDDLDLFTLPKSGVKSIRHAPRNLSDLRVVLDLKGNAHPSSFLLPPDPASGAGYRLVVDLKQGGAQGPVVTMDQRAQQLRDVVIAIDAGHGGKDPGAVGKRGTKEKDVVLSVSRKLEALVRRERGMRPVMIRTRDEFMPLRDRIAKARSHKADLFLSVHADASPDKRVHGSSVYVLSQNGASSELARWLAERENAADLVGGVTLNDKDELLASVLLDLSQTATLEASVDLAEDLLEELNRVGDIRRSRVEKAGFAVLKSPDIPSVLVETAFISNPTEERKLRSKAHQSRLAEAMLDGIRDYFRDNAPPGTVLAGQRRDRYVIRRGDTLSEIATAHHVSVRELRRANKLRNDRLLVGDVLLIPTRGG